MSYGIMEKLMHYVWKHRLWGSNSLSTNDGVPIRVIDTGLPNTDSGPDFFNAKVEIGGKLWVGNVEIHVRASDWKRHGHDHDKAYDNVILHVVEKDDAPVYRTGGERIPQMVMRCSPQFHERYDHLVNSLSEIPYSVYCAMDMYDAVNGADALLLLTEWRQFRIPAWQMVKSLMKTPVVIDGRNVYDADELEDLGFTYYCIGR